MMADVLVGCDVMPAAAHLTASMLSSVHPDVTYEKSRIITVPYGVHEDGAVALGSLDLLEQQGTLSILSTFGRAIGAMGEQPAETWESLPSASFDLVVMNPPFTRATGHEGAKIDVPIPMFAAFGNEEDEQRKMGESMKRLTKGTVYHGNAGEGSAFLQLAHEKLRVGGRLALVMPLSILAGEAWEKSRGLLRRGYDDIIVVTIAGEGAENAASFSADTGMGECLILATRAAASESAASARAIFAVLDRKPEHKLEGAEIGRLIRDLRPGGVSTLEGAPTGGTTLNLGDDRVGTVIDAPLPADDSGWGIARIRDLSIAQAALNLSAGRLWLPGMTAREAKAVPIARTGALATVGPYHMDINAQQAGGGIRGPFEKRDLVDGDAPTYPMLWGHDASEERAIVVQPDSYGEIRRGRSQVEKDLIARKAAAVWASASTVHVNRDFRFNSQSVAVAYTETPVIGGRAWPSILFTNEAHAKAYTLWSNTTLGLLLYWWAANKQQSGRGSVTITAIPDLPALDVTAITSEQLKAMVRVFDELTRMPLRPFNEIESDAKRVELDRRVLGEILGLPISGLLLLRRKLAAEPSIAGSKKRTKPLARPSTRPVQTEYDIPALDIRNVAESGRPSTRPPRKGSA
jgi:hypothetical protein